MDRRDFLLVTGSAAIGATAPIAARATAGPVLGVSTESAAARALSFDTCAVHAASWGEDQAVRFAGLVRETSGGNLVLAQQKTMTSSPDGGIFQSDVTWCSGDDLIALHPAFAYGLGLPGQFALTAHDTWAWHHVGGGQDLIDVLAEPFGVKLLLAGHRGTCPKLWTNEPIEHLAQLSGAKIHSSGLSAKVLAGLGAVPARVSEHDLGAAMAARVITGAELGGPLDGVSASVAGCTKFVSPAIGTPHGAGMMLAIRLPVWERLSGGEQALLAGAAARQHQLTLAEDRAYAPTMLTALVARFGIQHSEAKRELAIAAETVSRAVVAEIAALDEPSQRLNASYMAFKAALASGETPALA